MKYESKGVFYEAKQDLESKLSVVNGHRRLEDFPNWMLNAAEVSAYASYPLNMAYWGMHKAVSKLRKSPPPAATLEM